MFKKFVFFLIACVTISSCYAPGYVYQGGKKKKVRRSDVRVIESKKGDGSRHCSEEW